MSVKRAGCVLVALGVATAVYLSYGGFDVDVRDEGRVVRPPRTEAAAGGSDSQPDQQRGGSDAAASVGIPAAPAKAKALKPAKPVDMTATAAAYAKLHAEFSNDPSLKARCAAPVIDVDDAGCVPAKFETDELDPQLVGPRSTGETSKGMQTFPMDQLVGSPRPAAIAPAALRGNGTLGHHSIIRTFAKRTYYDKFFPSRVTEFTGAHAAAAYDCTEAIDFRQYHQVRALLCEMHEQLAAAKATTAHGLFPLVDEEYFEYVMTLTVAFEAAAAMAAGSRDGDAKPFVYLELGARYGTWAVRAGQAFRLFADAAGNAAKMKLLAVEGNCEWFRKMGEHVACNHLTEVSDLILAYAAPRSYNKVVLGDSTTHSRPRAVSLLDMIASYAFVDLIDFDIQGFEAETMEEPGAMDLFDQRVGFAHFGTHSGEVETRLLRLFQAHGWVVIYFFAGAHTKKLNHGHRCMTPFGPSGFNDGVLGFANPRFYAADAEELRAKAETVAPQPVRGSKKKRLGNCYAHPAAASLLFRDPSLRPTVAP